MLITCTQCQKALNLADDKVPSRPFVLTCPSCQHRQQIDPTQQAANLEPPPPAAPNGGDSVDEVPEIDAGPDGFVPLPSLRPQDAALLQGLSPESFIVNLGSQPAYQLTAGIKLLGAHNVQHFTDLQAACEAMMETEVGILLVVMDKASAPPCPPLEPLQQMPMEIRRRTFVGLVAENVRSLDGQVAFYLQVNCLINSQDITRFPTLLRRALLYHLRLYRAWEDEIATD